MDFLDKYVLWRDENYESSVLMYVIFMRIIFILIGILTNI